MAWGPRRESLVIDGAAAVPESGRYDFILASRVARNRRMIRTLCSDYALLACSIERGRSSRSAAMPPRPASPRLWRPPLGRLHQNPGRAPAIDPEGHCGALSCSAGLRIAQDSRPGSRAGAGCARRATSSRRTGAPAGALVGLLTGPWAPAATHRDVTEARGCCTRTRRVAGRGASRCRDAAHGIARR